MKRKRSNVIRFLWVAVTASLLLNVLALWQIRTAHIVIDEIISVLEEQSENINGLVTFLKETKKRYENSQ